MVSANLQRSSTRNIFLLLLLLTGILAGILFVTDHLAAGIILLVIDLMIINFLRKIYNSTNEAVSTFFDSLGNDDTTLHFTKIKGNASMNKLYGSMEKLNRHFQEIRMKNEYNESFYKTLIEFASTGLIVLDGTDSVVLINKVACNYAGISPESTNRNLLKIRHPEFYEAIRTIKPGETVTYKHLVSNNLQMLSFRASGIKRNDEELKLVSINDIRSELEYRELESYRKLMSVMTHEIMNLLSPITSVSKELYTQLNQSVGNDGNPMKQDYDISTAAAGLRLINEQAGGLINFMNNYRRISKIPRPEFATMDAEEWVGMLKIAFSVQMKENDIDFRINRDRNVHSIIADPNLINQVMINVINNAIDAVMEKDGDRIISVSMLKNNSERVQIAISNNGPEIPSELIEKIFVPFFTTKKNGSGIGLSICQEIMKLHKGSIMAISSHDGLTTFLIEV
jgi:signal transduction histidine kinase